MFDIKYERHLMTNPKLPFIFHGDAIRYNQSGIVNWHDNTEFLHCTEGEGVVNCDSNHIEMKTGDTIIINARCLHSINSEQEVKYHCLIIDNSFFIDNGIDIDSITFQEKLNDKNAADKMYRIASCMKDNRREYHVSQTRLAVLDYICYITEHFSHKSVENRRKVSKSYTAVLDTIEYINNHFSEKISLEELSAKAITELTAVNFTAPLLLTNLFLRDLKKNKGHLLCISSVTASKTNNTHGCAYGATKAGLSSFAKSLFEEVRKYGVRVTVLAPDMTKTELYRNASFTASEDTDAALTPEEVADYALFALTAREGLNLTELTMQPQYHRLERIKKSNPVVKI